jgi:hypothetical protein
MLKFKDTKIEQVGLTDKQQREDAEIDQDLLRIGHLVVDRQRQETFAQAWYNHWRSALWSIVLGTALVMEGMDTGMVRHSS